MSRTRTPPERVPADERTVRIARKRFARRQWARRWLALRGVVVALAVLALLAGAGWLVFFSSALTVEAVEVKGVDVLGSGEVRRVAEVPMGKPLATAPLEAIAARVESLAPVKAVDVTRSWPDTVRIAVLEREAVAVVERDGAVRGLDEEGILFRSYPRVPAGLPVVRISAATRTEALAEAAQVIDALPGDLAARVDHLVVETVDSITLQLRNGRTIFWGSAADSDNKAAVLAVLLEQKASLYDVSVPAQPTIKR
ncbi:MAG TPA: FtsQ-type POTRA domain-containing protein [Nocardioidaceae bacterium]|nr:FtsQ-type POTRA domain-containing protein [Nocardioidaceae bacterium]